MTAAGYTKNGDGLWEKDGKTINATINGFESIPLRHRAGAGRNAEERRLRRGRQLR